MFPGLSLSTFKKHGYETMFPGLSTFKKHGYETMFPGLSTFGKLMARKQCFMVCSREHARIICVNLY